MGDPATYLFATCHAGLEAWLKADVHRQRPSWCVAFERPGFVTWRLGDHDTLSLPLTQAPSVFAHAFGVCWGQARSHEQLVEWGAQLSAQHRALRLHIWARSGLKVSSARKKALRHALSDALPSAFLPDDNPTQPGEGVFDLVAVDTRDGDIVWWGGWHVHTVAHAPWPGGVYPVVTPAEAPSRAYIKLATALAWARIPMCEGDTALDLGSAPGGAAYAMLERDLDVWGVDPAAMAPSVPALAKARGRAFVHLRKAVGEVRADDLPEQVQWLVADMSLPAPMAWRYVRRLLPQLQGLRGVVLTLKLNDLAAVARLPTLLGDIAREGRFKSLKAAQLRPYRREVVAVGLR